MPVYEWEGRTAAGAMKSGLLKADSEADLRTMLRRDNIALLKASEQKEASGGKLLERKKVKQLSIVIFTRQLATMIASGLPLVQSLTILSNQLEDKVLRAIIGDVKDRIEGGSSFADALKQYPKVFDQLYVNLVLAGEEGGMLDSVLQRLANYMEKIEKLKKKVKGALIYPVSIVVVAIAVIMVLLIFVIPVFEGLFKDMGADLPAPTQMVVNLSKFMQKFWWLIIGIMAGIFILFKKYYKTESGARRIDKIVLKLPVFGIIALKASIAKVTRTLSTLLNSGVPILDSMQICSKIAGNKIIEEAFMVARSHITEGKSMSEPLAEQGIFPPMVVQMVHVGESTGALDTMLNKVADFYEEDVDNMVGNLTSMLEPAIMIFLGVVLGGLLVALYLPIFQIGKAVG